MENKNKKRYNDLLNNKRYNDLLEEHLELIRRLPKPFREPETYLYCPYCGNRGIHLRCDNAEFYVRGIRVKCDEIIAECFTCKQEIYIPSINDWNCENREYAYQKAKADNNETIEKLYYIEKNKRRSEDVYI